MGFRIGSNGLMVLVAKSVWVWCVGGCEIEVDRRGWCWPWVGVGLVRWWLRD